MDKKERILEVLKDVAQDAKDDATQFDGRPFNGKTVAEYFGNQGAAIATLADILTIVVNHIDDSDGDDK